MNVKELTIDGAYLLEPEIYLDNRGHFYEWFNLKRFHDKTGLDFSPVQFNCSRSKKGVLRGMHFQTGSHAQSKLIAVTLGEIQDVIVDVRKNSKTFGEYISKVLSEENKHQLYIPKGFAHGFLVLSDEAEIFYAIDNFYSPKSEQGICFNDTKIGIDWMLNENEIILSERDKMYDSFDQSLLKIKK